MTRSVSPPSAVTGAAMASARTIARVIAGGSGAFGGDW
jgi:hypothetical protein